MANVKKRKIPAPKKVVYLWGAGATQGEITYSGAAPVNLGMQDNDLGDGIASRVVAKLKPKWQSALLTDKGMDIEKLISLLVGSGVAEHAKMAAKIREYYFTDICNTLVKAKLLTDPKLAITLLEMHRHKEFMSEEVLTGIITTNHDGLLQVAAQHVYGHVNLGIPFVSSDINVEENGIPPIVQLHGSFTWSFGVPLRVSLLREGSKYSPDAVWIPPAILKESKSYPFNKLAGLAYEILTKRCDVLRVVGSSLTQNDWNVLSMLFNAQRHREAKGNSWFRIELIMPQDAGQRIAQTCSYLRDLFPIGQLSDGDFDVFLDETPPTGDMKNPLYYWLKEKITFHQRHGDLGPSALPSALAEVSGGAS